ncbi:Bug family tripartite tricarboxylate transporter substrate binding protein [Teichococcus aestuarii]|uniref:Bug family tripartite tricarboxylate transporter substrate binding protein n=1 Tax=Teichococcus aestuarii TaxID=568898 RepID=UPI003610CE56
MLGAALSRALGQPVVIDNRPGAATNIGADAAAKAAPDGLTLFSADNGTLVFNPALFSRLPYDPEKDFRPVGLMARFPLVLAVKQDSRLRDAPALVEAARRDPGGIDYGSPGIGSPHHLTMARLARETGITLTHIPYRGLAPAMNDLLAGRFEASILDLPSGGDFLRGKGARPLAVCGAERHPDLPGVPTVAEALGLRGFQAAAGRGWWCRRARRMRWWSARPPRWMPRCARRRCRAGCAASGWSRCRATRRRSAPSGPPSGTAGCR